MFHNLPFSLMGFKKEIAYSKCQGHGLSSVYTKPLCFHSVFAGAFFFMRWQKNRKVYSSEVPVSLCTEAHYLIFTVRQFDHYEVNSTLLMPIHLKAFLLCFQARDWECQSLPACMYLPGSTNHYLTMFGSQTILIG